MRTYRMLRARLIVIGILILTASVGAAPAERTRVTSSDASINGALLDEFGGFIGNFNASTNFQVENGVETTISSLNFFIPSCGFHADSESGATWVTVSSNNKGGSGSVTYSANVGGVQWDVTFTGSGSQVFQSRVSGVLEMTDGTTQRIRINQDEVPFPTNQLDIAMNGVSCFSGSLSDARGVASSTRATITQ